MALVVLFALSGTPASAANVDGSATLLTEAMRDPRDGKLYTEVPTFALLSLLVDGMQTRWMTSKLVLQGWGTVDPAQPRSGQVAATNVDAAYFVASLWKKQLTVRLGRQLIIGGVARNLRIDGIFADGRIIAGLSAQAWAGAVLGERYAPVVHANFATGARLYYRLTSESEAGASYLMLRDGDGFAREDLGLDARVRAMRQLTLQGYADWSLLAARFAEGDVRATYQPIAILQLTAVCRHTEPDLFLSQQSIFSVFAQTAHDAVGGEASVLPYERLTLSGNGYWLKTPAGQGFRAAGRLTQRLGERKQTLVGIDVSVLRQPVVLLSQDGNGLDGYVQTRLFVATRIKDRVLVTVDFDNYSLVRRLNGQNNSFTAAATVGYDLTPAWQATVAGSAGENPFVSEYAQLMVRATYRFSTLPFAGKTL